MPRESVRACQAWWSAADAPAQLAVGEVRHTRHRPRRHAFRYPAYFLRLPMRRLDAAFAGQRFVSHNRFNLLSFADADHGDRGGRVPLVTWLTGVLASAGITDADGEIWLHTFPRVLGYAFKPVSFWFCQRSDGSLRAILCEINNTFGERHCYLLAHDDGRAISDGELLVARKAFHVSPFCPIRGGYRFRFVNARSRALARIEFDDAVDDTIDGPVDGSPGPLLSTSLSGTLEPIGDRAVLSAFFRMPLFSFGVIARIHWQAIRLWGKRAPFFSKPAPPAAEVSR